jgi:hypothetical protein
VRHARLAAIGALVALAPTACGEDDSDRPAATAPRPQERLTPAERARAQHSERAILAYCRRLALSVGAAKELPSASQQGAAFQAARRLTVLAGKKPGATVRTGVDTQLFVSDLIEDLEGSNCDPRLAAALEQGLAAPP